MPTDAATAPETAAIHEAAVKLADEFTAGVEGVTGLVRAMKEFAASDSPRVASAAAAVLSQFPPLVDALNEFIAASREVAGVE